jgi:glycerate dehydrogenase
VAQLTFALLLELCHHVGSHNDAVKSGRWSSNPDFCFWDHDLIELAGKTLGIIGYGNIGRSVARIAVAFGMNVLVYDVSSPGFVTEGNIRITNFDTILKQSDIISLHCPLTESTRNMINKETIFKMKDGIIIINTARGPLINELDLSHALREGKVYAAAVDVVSVEPVETGNPLLGNKNCIMTPHIAWAPKEARKRLMNTAVNNLRSFIAGSPENVVN